MLATGQGACVRFLLVETLHSAFHAVSNLDCPGLDSGMSIFQAPQTSYFDHNTKIFRDKKSSVLNHPCIFWLVAMFPVITYP